MIDAGSFVKAAKERGLGLWTGVPCSYLKPFINYTIDSPLTRYVPASNEGDAIAIASGSWVGGVGGVVMFQNSGFGNAVNPLSSLNMIHKIPILVICSWRGEPGGEPDEPQHELMGQITPRSFELLGIPWELFPQHEADIVPVLERALRHMLETRTPYALIMQKDSVAPYKLKPSEPLAERRAVSSAEAWTAERPRRQEVLKAIQACKGKRDVLIATTGYTGRELYALEDREDQLYMVGAMGCASSFSLGLALAQTDRQVIVLDGDGAALMRLGALATIGIEAPKNLVHVILDNEMHESTGAQATTSSLVDLGAVAIACGYPSVVRARRIEELEAAVRNADQLTCVHVKVSPGVPDKLPRPTVRPDAVTLRLKRMLEV